MNVWVALLIGLLLGWLVEFLIDYFYWRDRRLCPEDTAVALRSEVARVEADKVALQQKLDQERVQVGQLQATLQGRGARLNELETALSGREVELARLQGDVDARVSQAATWQARHTDLEATLAAREGLLAQAQARNTTLSAELDACRRETAELRAHMNDVDSGFKGLGIGALAGGALGGLGARFAALRDRLTGQEAETGELKGQVARDSAELMALRAAVSQRESKAADLSAELDAKALELSRLQADLSAAATQVDALQAQVEAQSAELADLSVAQARVGALESDLAACQERLNAWQAGAALGGVGLAAGAAAALGAQTEDEPAVELASDIDMGMPALDAQLTTPVEVSVEAANLGLGMPALDAASSGPGGLSMVWGLNTQANQLLERQGITRYEQLSATAPGQVADALTVSHRYYPGLDNEAIHAQWVQQSRLAAAGDWDGLAAFQSGYDRRALRDDLKLLWGIGPKIEQVLNDNGIYLFAQLASAPSERITEILRRAGPRFRMTGAKLHESWPLQARLADAGEWDALQALTDRLSWSEVH